MPWRVRRMLVLLGCAFGALALGAIVIIRNKSVDDTLLGAIAVLGGIAIIFTTILPANGADGDATARRHRDGDAGP